MVKLHHRETKPISEGGSSLRLQVSSRTGGSSAQNEPNLPKSSMRNEPNFPRAESPGPADCAKRTQLGWSAGALKGEMCKTNPICRSQACETNPISPRAESPGPADCAKRTQFAEVKRAKRTQFPPRRVAGPGRLCKTNPIGLVRRGPEGRNVRNEANLPRARSPAPADRAKRSQFGEKFQV